MAKTYGPLRVPPDQVPGPAFDPPGTETGDTIVLGGGCFWCTEAVYKELDGVLTLRSGYAGGTAETANYKAVCSGRTDHAEVIEIKFDPERITLGKILRVFFSVAHDPTQLNRQGNDMGRQYRSAVFYANEIQREVARAYIDQLTAAEIFTGPLVTSLEPLEAFFEAESYHQDYAARNPYQPYIAVVSSPKVQKLKEYFAEDLK